MNLEKSRIPAMLACAAALSLPAGAQPFVEFQAGNWSHFYYGNAAWGNIWDNGQGDLDLALQGIGRDDSWLGTLNYNYGGTGGLSEIVQMEGLNGGSLSWGDYNRDGYLDLLQTGWNGNTGRTFLWRNEGNNLVPAPLGGLPECSGRNAWIDYDNDGRLDVLLMGGIYPGGTRVTRLYHNDGSSFSQEPNFSATGLTDGNLAVGDYDNDGDVDILITGMDGSGAGLSQLYYNLGGRAGFALRRTFDPVRFSSAAFIDFDADGLMDVLVSGQTNQGATVLNLYRNNGNQTFTQRTGHNLPAFYEGDFAVADYDNDGRQDLALCGMINGLPDTRLYRNPSNNGTFSEVAAGFQDVWRGDLAWGDFDNDSRIDLALIGRLGAGDYHTKIYLNNTPNANSLPSAPGAPYDLALGNGSVLLRWDRSTDPQLSGSLNRTLGYNIRMFRQSDGSPVLSPMADAAGLRLLPEPGRMRGDVPRRSQMAQYRVNNLAIGSMYSIEVQAIDNNLQGGPFSGSNTGYVTGGACYGDYMGGTSGTQTLSSTGVKDWAAWGLNTNTSFNHKNGSPVPNLIGNYTVINGTTSNVFRQTVNVPAFTWTGGTPTASATAVTRGVMVNSLGRGFQVLVSATTTEQTLSLYLGVNKATARLEAAIDDGFTVGGYDGSGWYIDRLENRTGLTNGYYQIKFKCAPGQTGRKLRLRITEDQDWAPGDNSEMVSLQAAKLQ